MGLEYLYIQGATYLESAQYLQLTYLASQAGIITPAQTSHSLLCASVDLVRRKLRIYLGPLLTADELGPFRISSQ